LRRLYFAANALWVCQPANRPSDDNHRIPTTDYRLRKMTTHDLTEKAIALAYRISGYALLNWVDDAAMLALIFC
jgi:hypothetical protein